MNNVYVCCLLMQNKINCKVTKTLLYTQKYDLKNTFLSILLVKMNENVIFY